MVTLTIFDMRETLNYRFIINESALASTYSRNIEAVIIKECCSASQNVLNYGLFRLQWLLLLYDKIMITHQTRANHNISMSR